MRFLRRPQAGQVFQPWMLTDILDVLEKLSKITGDQQINVSEGPDGYQFTLSAAILSQALQPQLFIQLNAPTISGGIALYPWTVQNYTGGSWTAGSGSGTPVTPPSSAPTVSNSGTGGSIPAATYYVVVAWNTATGPTNYSPEASTTTTGTASTITVNAPASPPTGATGWIAYIGTTSGGPYYQQGGSQTLGVNATFTSYSTSGSQANNNHNAAKELNNFYGNPGNTLIVPAWYTNGGSQVLFQLDYCSTPVGS